MVRYGFTGTQRGMTAAQQAAVRALLAEAPGAAPECHHGDCIGADADFHRIAVDLGCRVVVHPPDSPAKRAWCTGHEVRPEAPYLVRNHAIVDEVDVLVATPGEEAERLRSGTWATVRYARKRGVPVLRLRPDGTLVDG